jgi:cytochrome b561
MTAKSTSTTYGSVAVSIHWITALLIIGLLVSGTLAEESADPATKALILSAHAPMGIAVLLLTLGRLAWWWRFDNRPAPLGGDPAWQETIAKLVHGLLSPPPSRHSAASSGPSGRRRC